MKHAYIIKFKKSMASCPDNHLLLCYYLILLAAVLLPHHLLLCYYLILLAAVLLPHHLLLCYYLILLAAVLLPHHLLLCYYLILLAAVLLPHLCSSATALSCSPSFVFVSNLLAAKQSLCCINHAGIFIIVKKGLMCLCCVFIFLLLLG